MKAAYIVITAFVGGLLGGVIVTQLNRTYPQVGSPEVIRAQQFELVDKNGATLAFWGTDENKNVVLAFAKTRQMSRQVQSNLKEGKNQRMSIGVLADGSPWIGFMGTDGHPRFQLHLTEYDKPFMMLEDENGPRVALGLDQSDTHDPADDDWTLVFDPYTEKATIGMIKDPITKHLYGGLWLNGRKLKLP